MVQRWLTMMMWLAIGGALHVTGTSGPLDALPEGIPLPDAPALPPPPADALYVRSVDELFQAATDVPPGGTIVVADGHYWMPRYIQIRTDGVTLRGESGDPGRTILDGARSRHGELLGITGCEGVTVADLTVQNIMWNGIKLNSDRGIQRISIHHCIIRNIWQRGVKGVRVPAETRETMRPRDCRIQYCIFLNDRAKTFEDDTADAADSRFGGNYIGGIDVMYATNWLIADNLFYGIRGRTGEARGAVFLWHDARGCVVERNLIVDCDTGICLGNSHRGDETRIHATGCVVRNNFLTRTPETGILADYTRICSIVHNTIHDPESRLGRLIRLVHDNDGLTLANNLLSGPDIRRDHVSGSVDERGNVSRVLTAAFANPRAGDLHLAVPVAGITRAVRRLPVAETDIDTGRRPERCTVGADEPPSD